MQQQYTDRLKLALSVISSGATSMRHAASMFYGIPNVVPLPTFSYNALAAPLEELARLLENPPRPTPPATAILRQVRRQAPRPRRSRRAVPQAPSHASAGLEKRILPLLRGIRPQESPDNPSACRALLLEIIRRAAYDWVLYRTSSKLGNRQLAESAYHWLFVEDRWSSSWSIRERNEKGITGFLAICDILELDPEQVRRRVRKLTPVDIMSAGRPAERRKHKTSEESLHSDDLRVFDVNVDALPVFDPLYSTRAEG